MKTYRYLRCDVFTDRAFAGNPLVVFSNALGLSDPQMQAIAREMNLSETVFVLPPREGGTARLRIFTPSRELTFAGHPTLGAAFAIGDVVHLPVLVLETGRGPVPVRLTREGARVTWGMMQQPLAIAEEFTDHATVAEALGLSPRVPVGRYTNGPSHLVAVLDSPEAVARLRPNANALARLGLVTLSAVAMIDPTRAHTRVFYDEDGLREDPATGSAAGAVITHLAAHGLLGDAPIATLTLAQGAEIGRPSEIEAIITRSAGAVTQVEVGGAAIIVGRGELKV
ncbi:MAG: PhzF family phenazine biosynthesis protein [Myxococcales bacterium]|nr:PhzF family phenazine biosynthesis protein [Myxococcales bacterium]